jgi:hypothetical protein
MNFRRVEPNEYYSTLRMCSQGNEWQFGLSLGPTGLRLRMGKAGRPPRVLDFCLGRDSSLYGPVILAVMGRLELLPESSSETEIDALFPWAGTRPDLGIHLEPLLSTVEIRTGGFFYDRPVD